MNQLSSRLAIANFILIVRRSSNNKVRMEKMIYIGMMKDINYRGNEWNLHGITIIVRRKIFIS